MTTTRRMVYAQIANAVLAGYPEPESQEFGPNEVVRLTFDSHAAATQWARWFGPDCEAGGYTADVLDTGRSLRCYHGKRSDWSWQIVGREPIAAEARLKVPCGRCGHDENIHQYDTASNQTGRLCIECRGWCAPVLVQAGVEGWAIDGRTK